MIVRNEARCIERCLLSVRPWVRRMVVLDTGSTDDTVARAQAQGAEVFHAPWPDDFAAARNLALGRSDAPWRLVLDADEWLIEGGPALLEALAQRPEPTWAGVVSVESRFEQGGHDGIGITRITRLLPRGACYAGRVHEQVQGDWPRVALPVRLGHDGYEAAAMARKQGRNDTLLVRSLQEQPHDAYLWYQRGKEAESAGRWPDAAAHYAQADALAEAQAPWQADLTVRWLHCLSMARCHDQAIALASERQPRWSGHTDFNFVVGTVMMNCACDHPDRALACLEIAQASWEACLALGEQPQIEGAVLGRGSHLAAWNLMALHQALGQAAQGQHYEQLAATLRAGATPRR